MDKSFINRKLFWILFLYIILEYIITVRLHTIYDFFFMYFMFLTMYTQGGTYNIYGLFLQNNYVYKTLDLLKTFKWNIHIFLAFLTKFF